PRTVARSGRARATPSAASRARAPRRARRPTAPTVRPSAWLASRLGAREVLDRVAPVRPAVRLTVAVHGLEIGLLDRLRDLAHADLDVIDLADRRHLRRGAAHEDLVGDVEVRADQVLLHDRVSEVLRDLDDRVARDP